MSSTNIHKMTQSNFSNATITTTTLTTSPTDHRINRVSNSAIRVSIFALISTLYRSRSAALNGAFWAVAMVIVRHFSGYGIDCDFQGEYIECQAIFGKNHPINPKKITPTHLTPRIFRLKMRVMCRPMPFFTTDAKLF